MSPPCSGRPMPRSPRRTRRPRRPSASWRLPPPGRARCPRAASSPPRPSTGWRRRPPSGSAPRRRCRQMPRCSPPTRSPRPASRRLCPQRGAERAQLTPATAWRRCPPASRPTPRRATPRRATPRQATHPRAAHRRGTAAPRRPPAPARGVRRWPLAVPAPAATPTACPPPTPRRLGPHGTWMALRRHRWHPRPMGRRPSTTVRPPGRATGRR
mmetsp:Transcript_83276/g.231086  ORF Transcript_83276/g.231086 Transcript_83276/m.231086 type:complete len:213 (+) Transcript_83276:146-784(+)